MSMPVILVVESDASVGAALVDALRKRQYAVDLAATCEKALARFLRGIDAVVIDEQLSDVEVGKLVRRIRRHDSSCPIMMMADPDAGGPAETTRAEASYRMRKPVEPDAVVRWLSEVLPPPAAGHSSFDAIVGVSAAALSVRAVLERLARSPCGTVLLTGESGTGKGLAARALHEASDRSQRPFTNITCTALTATLLESELFGHERGAFTDAQSRKRGLFELAQGGTVFLDEIGDMAPQLQAKLLRVLEDGSFRRVGGSEDICVDVRVVAATHVDLREAIRERRFRDDLYYRLAVFVVDIPPLRDRPEDIEPLTQRFVADCSRTHGRRPPCVSPEAMELLRGYAWPGNMRELRNVLERAVFLSDAQTLGVENFESVADASASPPSLDVARAQLPAGGIDLRMFERQMVEQALRRTGGNITRAADLLGLTRDQMRYRVDKFGLRGTLEDQRRN